MAIKEKLLRPGWWVLPVVLAVVLSLDQWTKALVASQFEPYESWAPLPALANVFTIHYVTNTGAAFGLFQDSNTFFVIVAIVVSAVVLYYYVRLPGGQWWIRLSFGMMLSGALGNMIDRLRVGYVIDFFDLQIWPVFNVADMSIVGGTILLAVLLLLEDRAERKRLQSVDSAERV